MTYYVYELVDPRTGAVFYVGKGKGSRIDQHEVEARQGRVSRKCDVIREIEAASLAVGKRKVRFFPDEQDAYDFEAEHIATFAAGSLTNIQPGGGASRFRFSLAADRIRVKAAAEMLRRTAGGQITGIWLGKTFLDLKKIAEEYTEAVGKIIERRSLQWVNDIASRRNVEFVVRANG